MTTRHASRAKYRYRVAWPSWTETLLGFETLDISEHQVHQLRKGINAGIPQRVVDTWLGHRSDRSMGSVYYKLSDEDSRQFMLRVPLGTGQPGADPGKS